MSVSALIILLRTMLSRWTRSRLEEASHRCGNGGYCMEGHSIIEPRHINTERDSDCMQYAVTLCRRGQAVPEHCGCHGPPCLLRLQAEGVLYPAAMLLKEEAWARGHRSPHELSDFELGLRFEVTSEDGHSNILDHCAVNSSGIWINYFNFPIHVDGTRRRSQLGSQGLKHTIKTVEETSRGHAQQTDGTPL